MDRYRRWTVVLAVLSLACAVLLTAQTWSGQFLSDDFGIIWQANRVLAEQRATDHLLGSFVNTEGLQSGFYRPIGLASWILSALISGVDPWGWRIANLLLHLLNGWLVYRLVARMAGSQDARPAAWLAAAAFWLYPLAPEASVWIAGRYDLLALTGALFACERHLASRHLFDAPRMLSLAALAFALGSKEAAITAPALFFLLGLVTSEQRPVGVSTLKWLARSVTRSLRDCLPALTLLVAYFLLRKSLFGDAIQVYSTHKPLLAFEPAEFLRRLVAMTPAVREPFGATTPWLITITLGVLGAGFVVSIRRGHWLRWWLLPGLATTLTVIALLVHFAGAESNGMGARFFYATGAWLAIWLFLPFADTSSRLPRALCATILLPTFALCLSMAIAPWREAGLAMRDLLPAIIRQSGQLNAHDEYGIVLVPDHIRTAVFARNAQGGIGMGGLRQQNPHPDSILATIPFTENVVERMIELGSYPVPEGKSVRTFCFDAHAQITNEHLVEIKLATPMTEPRAWWGEWVSAVTRSPCAKTFPDLQ
jgi:hypothetical protein